MPTVQKQSREDRLTDVLTRQFTQNPPTPTLPFVIINALRGGRSQHILVIWDEWESLERTRRSAIILDAFERAFPGQSRHVTIAMGLTLSEALSMGYLPFKIEPAVRAADNVSPARIRKALDSAGGALIKIGKQSQLRFPSLEQAQHAYRTLQQLEPGPFWTIVQETSQSESA